MKMRDIQWMVALVAACLTLAATRAQAQNLVLTIDKTTGQVDWPDGFSITKTTGIDDNRFGSLLTRDAEISSPLPSYSGSGIIYFAAFDFSPDGARIQGIGLGTTLPPGNPASFAGTPEGPAVPVFTTGNMTQFTSLTDGDYTLPPVAAWSGGIEVKVVPEPATGMLGVLSVFALLLGCFGQRRVGASTLCRTSGARRA